MISAAAQQHHANATYWLLLGLLAALGAVAGRTVVHLDPHFMAALILAVPAAVIALIRPTAAFYLFVVALIMTTSISYNYPGAYPLRDFDPGRGLPSIVRLQFILLFLGFWFHHHLARMRSSALPWTHLGVFLPILGLGVLTGVRNHSDLSMLQTDLLNFLLPVLWFYLCMSFLSTKKRIQRLLWVTFTACAIHALVLDVYYCGGLGPPFQLAATTRGSRVVSLDSSALLGFSSMSLLGIVCFPSTPSRPHIRILAALGIATMLFALTFSFRRGEWLGTLLASGAIVVQGGRAGRKRILAIGCIAALVAVIAVPVTAGTYRNAPGSAALIVARLQSLVDPTHDSNRHHLLEPIQVTRDLTQSPVFGLGLGAEHSPVPGYARNAVPLHVVHNTPLYCWMKLGALGVALMGFWLYRYLRRIHAYLRRHPGPAANPIIVTLAATVLLWGVQLMTAPIPWYYQQSFMMAMFAAVVVNLIRIEEETET